MKQAKFIDPFSIEINDVPIPEIGDNDVLLKITRIGICGSDLQMYHGKHKYMTYPVVPGHEAAACIERTGSNVTELSKGQRVTIQPQVFCGECYPCRIGRPNVCENLSVMGVHKDGYAQEYVAINQKYVLPCPNDMDYDKIVLVEPLSVGVGSARRVDNLKGANVVVVGAGTIGNLVAQSCSALGAAKVLITDISQQKLDFAKKTGLVNCVNTSNTSLKSAIAESFGLRKADAIIDCAATKGSIKSILDAARPSSQIIVTGNFKEPVAIEMPVLQRQEIDLKGHMMYVRSDYETAIQLIKDGLVCLEGFVTQQNSLPDFKKALDDIDNNPEKVIKSVLYVG